MARLFKIEFIKATKNKLFLISVLIGIVLCVYSAVYVICSYYNDLEDLKIIAEQSECIINPMASSFSLYNKWIGQEWVSMASSLLFLLLPLTASLPYSWNYCIEKKSGYINNVFTRVNKGRYIKTKFLTTFLVGAISIFIPLLINIMIVSSFIPAAKPNVYYDIYYNMPISCVFSEMFYKTPLLYTVMKVLLISSFGGSFAVLGQATGTIIKNKFIAVLFPFVFMLLFNYIVNVFSGNIELSPIQFLYGGGDALTSYWIVISELVVLLTSSFLIMKIKGEKKDVL